ncbi:MAG: hypothetical protein JO108_09950 [Acidobacteriaceae bacterium]|nr:hypothetical protein [Acidobacteriaceae bacterium]
MADKTLGAHGVASWSNSPGRRTLSVMFSMAQRGGSRSTSSKYDPLIAISVVVRRRSLCPQEGHSEPVPAHSAQLAELALQVGDHLPIRQPAIVQPFRERGQLARGLVRRVSP